jgi:hypothetical protein
LSSLQAVEDNLEVIYCDQIQQLTGLDALLAVGGYLNISNNNNLTDLWTTPTLTAIGEGIQISNNPQLSSLQSLSSLAIINGELEISNNSSLQNLDGLNNLAQMNGNLDIQENAVLQQVDALSNLTLIQGELEIVGNPQLASLTGLQNVDPQTIEALVLAGNTILSYCALPNICSYIENQFGPIYLDELSSATGCSTVNEILADCVLWSKDAPNNNNLLVYPNPSDTQAHISNFKPGQSFKLFNSKGVLLPQEISKEGFLRVSELPNGLYLLYSEEGNFKLLVQH